MTETIIAVWSASVVLLFFPIGSAATLVRRRLAGPHLNAVAVAEPAELDAGELAQDAIEPSPAEPAPVTPAQVLPEQGSFAPKLALLGQRSSAPKPVPGPFAPTQGLVRLEQVDGDHLEATGVSPGVVPGRVESDSAETSEDAIKPTPAKQEPVALEQEAGDHLEATSPGPDEAGGDTEPDAQAALATRGSAWARSPGQLVSWSAVLALYVVFIASSVYLAPRLMQRVLGSAHPMAAVTSESMYPTLQRGDLVFIEGVGKPADLKVGDIVAFKHKSGFAIHRIVRIKGASITTKGDANPISDEPITFDQVIGRTFLVEGHLAKIPYLGHIPLIFGSTSELQAQTDQ